MKTLLSIIVLLTIIFIGCGQPNKTSKLKSTNTESLPKEDFFVFISDFSLEADFQLMRTEFPFPDCYYKDAESMEIVWDSISKDKWENLSFIHPSSGMAAINTFFDNFEATDRETDERVFATFEPEGDFAIHYYFKNINGKWYLIKRRNFSY